MVVGAHWHGAERIQRRDPVHDAEFGPHLGVVEQGATPSASSGRRRPSTRDERRLAGVADALRSNQKDNTSAAVMSSSISPQPQQSFGPAGIAVRKMQRMRKDQLREKDLELYTSS